MKKGKKKKSLPSIPSLTLIWSSVFVLF
jgi:hypothetical protein